MKYLTEERKQKAVKLYLKRRDRIIWHYLRYLKKQVKASKDFSGEDYLYHVKMRKRYDRLAKAYWEGKHRRPLGFLSTPDKTGRRYHPPGLPAFLGPAVVVDEESPRYGILPEGYYYLVLDGAELRAAVHSVVIDEATTTITMHSVMK